ncbi:transcriptional regulator with XRE-family HTH domain [Actinokineospora baliensis]|uniref:helix-turn-helix domain-containing protein n=1 Tax=Actinokineospora baliensis TaxID=547056 RepID=UPI00195E6575|nr:helix-turn-helix domain-containing protein [Actinokineospora baliensis]MBM7770091.1 transcriptional regulator with XRE-family HTH domain [Actinokineospora baliensis]
MSSKRKELADTRKAAGLSQEELARRLGVDRTTVTRWETAESSPQPWIRPKLARALGVTPRGLDSLLKDTAPRIEAPGGEGPITEAYVDWLRQHVRQLLLLDAQFGGNEASGQAVRLLRSAVRRIGVDSCPQPLWRDLMRAVGELAEVAGWLLYDADQQDASRRLSLEALHYLRLAGDRELELLTLQNLSMQAEYLGRTGEALQICDAVLDGTLSGRVRGLFLGRQAHALAKRGQHSEAARRLSEARATLEDDGPGWAYWVDERQFAWFEGMLGIERGDFDHAAGVFAEALASTPPERVRGAFSRSVYLLDCLVRAGDVKEAERLVPDVAARVGEVGSGRTVALLRGVAKRAELGGGGDLAGLVRESGL